MVRWLPLLLPCFSAEHERIETSIEVFSTTDLALRHDCLNIGVVVLGRWRRPRGKDAGAHSVLYCNPTAAKILGLCASRQDATHSFIMTQLGQLEPVFLADILEHLDRSAAGAPGGSLTLHLAAKKYPFTSSKSSHETNPTSSYSPTEVSASASAEPAVNSPGTGNRLWRHAVVEPITFAAQDINTGCANFPSTTKARNHFNKYRIDSGSETADSSRHQGAASIAPERGSRRLWPAVLVTLEPSAAFLSTALAPLPRTPWAYTSRTQTVGGLTGMETMQDCRLVETIQEVMNAPVEGTSARDALATSSVAILGLAATHESDQDVRQPVLQASASSFVAALRSRYSFAQAPGRWDLPGPERPPESATAAAAAADAAQLRQGMVLTGLTPIVTAVTARGDTVLYQNVTSIFYYGDRGGAGVQNGLRPEASASDARTDVGVAGILADLFSLEPTKLDRMLADVCKEGRVWRGIVQVPPSCHPVLCALHASGYKLASPSLSLSPAAATAVHRLASDLPGAALGRGLSGTRPLSPALSPIYTARYPTATATNTESAAGTIVAMASHAEGRETSGQASAAAAAAGSLTRGPNTMSGALSLDRIISEALWSTVMQAGIGSAVEATPVVDAPPALQLLTANVEIDPLATSTWGLLMDAREHQNQAPSVDATLRSLNRSANSMLPFEASNAAAPTPAPGGTGGSVSIPRKLRGHTGSETVPPLSIKEPSPCAPPKAESLFSASRMAGLRAPYVPTTTPTAGPASHMLQRRQSGVLRRSSDVCLRVGMHQAQTSRPPIGTPSVPNASALGDEYITLSQGQEAELEVSGRMASFGVTMGGLRSLAGCRHQAPSLNMRPFDSVAGVSRAELSSSSRNITRVVTFASSLRHTPSALQFALQITNSNSQIPAAQQSGTDSGSAAIRRTQSRSVLDMQGSRPANGCPSANPGGSARSATGRSQQDKCLLAALPDVAYAAPPASGGGLQRSQPSTGTLQKWITRREVDVPGDTLDSPTAAVPVPGRKVDASLTSHESPRSVFLQTKTAVLSLGSETAAARTQPLRSQSSTRTFRTNSARAGIASLLAKVGIQRATGAVSTGCTSNAGCGVAHVGSRVESLQPAELADKEPQLIPQPGRTIDPTPSGEYTVIDAEDQEGEDAGGDQRRQVPRQGPATCWHEVTAARTTDPVTGQCAIVLTQVDVTAKVEAERHLAFVTEAEHRLLEQIFPRHVLAYMTEEGCPWGPESSRVVGACDRPMVRDINVLATSHNEVTLLFADIQGFTPMCKTLEPRVVMAFLNELFTCFDSRLDEFGVYKVETIGDCYFVAGGLIHEDEQGMAAVRERSSNADPLHAERVFSFAKAMLSAAAQVTLPTTGGPVRVRIGIHSGPVVSGVVGQRMPRFCLFGDTVNTASRMESTGVAGCIHASETVQVLLRDEAWIPTGGIEVKGKGQMNTFLWVPPDNEDSKQVLLQEFAQRVSVVGASASAFPSGAGGNSSRELELTLRLRAALHEP